MSLISRGRSIGRAVKNVQRLRHILAVFAKHGFGDLANRMDLGRFLPTRLQPFSGDDSEITIPIRLRLAFEELGPAFIKLGQILSTRSDLLPDAYIEEFSRLQDNVHPVPFEQVRPTIEASLGRRLTDVFASIETEPLGAASISQVYAAVLPTGEKVVVKVQRPDVDRMVKTDSALLVFLAELLERYVPETRLVNPIQLAEEFARALSYELDFVIEANNMAKIAANMAAVPEVVIPKVYRHLSSHRVLVQERLEGIRANDLAGLDAARIDRKRVVDIGARSFFKSVMIDGLFHGDLHGGNIFILPGDRIGIVDFGIVGRLGERSRAQLAAMVVALLSEDYDNLCYQYAELGSAQGSIDFDAFSREVRSVLSPHMGLSIQELNVGRVLIDATRIAARYNIQVPGDWMVVFRAILTIEGMGRVLDPGFDLIATGQELAKDLVKDQFSSERFVKEAGWILSDFASLLRVLPRQLKWGLRKLNANDWAIEVRSPELELVRKQLEINGRRQGLSVMISGLSIAGALSLSMETDHKLWGMPWMSCVMFLFALFLTVRLFFRSFR